MKLFLKNKNIVFLLLFFHARRQEYVFLPRCVLFKSVILPGVGDLWQKLHIFNPKFSKIPNGFRGIFSMLLIALPSNAWG